MPLGKKIPCKNIFTGEMEKEASIAAMNNTTSIDHFEVGHKKAFLILIILTISKPIPVSKNQQFQPVRNAQLAVNRCQVVTHSRLADG